MGLWRKMKILVGALVHAPFSSRPAEPGTAEPDEGEGSSPPGQPGRERLGAGETEGRGQGTVDEERVADLIARQRQSRE